MQKNFEEAYNKFFANFISSFALCARLDAEQSKWKRARNAISQKKTKTGTVVHRQTGMPDLSCFSKSSPSSFVPRPSSLRSWARSVARNPDRSRGARIGAMISSRNIKSIDFYRSDSIQLAIPDFGSRLCVFFSSSFSRARAAAAARCARAGRNPRPWFCARNGFRV